MARRGSANVLGADRKQYTRNPTTIEKSQTSRVMWYLWPATEGCSFLRHIWGKERTLHVNVETRQNESPRLSGVLGLLHRVSYFLGKILR